MSRMNQTERKLRLAQAMEQRMCVHEDWCDNIGREVHMKGDDEPPRGIVPPIAFALLAIAGLSLALWALICLPLIYLLKAFGFW